jgi:hypothetical protein
MQGNERSPLAHHLYGATRTTEKFQSEHFASPEPGS